MKHGCRLLLALTLCLSLSGCGNAPSALPTVEGDTLIGGTPVGSRLTPAAQSIVLIELLTQDEEYLTFCTGTLVEANIVLTAAHCFDRERFPTLRKFNVLFVNSLGEYGAVPSQGVALSLHPNFNSQKVLDHDVAVLLFKQKAPAGYNAVKIDEDVKAEYGSRKVLVYGYGRTADHTGEMDEVRNPGILHKGEMRIGLDYKRFPDRYYTQLQSDSFLCQGDSGGPQFFHERGVLKIVGINSGAFGQALPNGQRSCRGQAQATKVAPFARWIKKEIRTLKKKHGFSKN